MRPWQPPLSEQIRASLVASRDEADRILGRGRAQGGGALGARGRGRSGAHCEPGSSGCASCAGRSRASSGESRRPTPRWPRPWPLIEHEAGRDRQRRRLQHPRRGRRESAARWRSSSRETREVTFRIETEAAGGGDRRRCAAALESPRADRGDGNERRQPAGSGGPGGRADALDRRSAARAVAERAGDDAAR